MTLKVLEVFIFCSLVLMSFLLVTNPIKVNIRANRWFGAFLLLWSSYWIDEFVFAISGVRAQISTLGWVSFIQIYTALFFYISICFFTNPNYKIRKHIWKFSIIPSLYLLAIFNKDFLGSYFYAIQLSFVLIHALLYSALSLIKIQNHQKVIQQFASSTQSIDLRWIKYIIYSVFALLLIVGVFNLVFYELPLNKYMNLVVFAFVLFIAYYSLKQSDVFPTVNNELPDSNDYADNAIVQNEKKLLLPDDKVEELKKCLCQLMDEKELYLDCDLNLIKLASELKITSHQLSFIINHGFNQNFFQFVNTYRVQKAKELLKSDSNDKLSMLGVAFESGFSSKTSFNTTFKKMTNQTPSEFKRTGSVL